MTESLVGALDRARSSALSSFEGVSVEDLGRRPAGSSVSLADIARHLVEVEEGGPGALEPGRCGADGSPRSEAWLDRQVVARYRAIVERRAGGPLAAGAEAAALGLLVATTRAAGRAAAVRVLLSR